MSRSNNSNSLSRTESLTTGEESLSWMLQNEILWSSSGPNSSVSQDHTLSGQLATAILGKSTRPWLSPVFWVASTSLTGMLGTGQRRILMDFVSFVLVEISVVISPTFSYLVKLWSKNEWTYYSIGSFSLKINLTFRSSCKLSSPPLQRTKYSFCLTRLPFLLLSPDAKWISSPLMTFFR